MNLQQIVTELKADRDRIDRAIILRTGSDSWACFAFAHRAQFRKNAIDVPAASSDRQY